MFRRPAHFQPPKSSDQCSAWFMHKHSKKELKRCRAARLEIWLRFLPAVALQRVNFDMMYRPETLGSISESLRPWLISRSAVGATASLACCTDRDVMRSSFTRTRRWLWNAGPRNGRGSFNADSRAG